MGERELRAQIHHLLGELELTLGLLNASTQSPEVVALLQALRRRRGSFSRAGFDRGFSGYRIIPPVPPPDPFPSSCSPATALLRLAWGCDAAADQHDVPEHPLRRSDLLSFAETLREAAAGKVKRRAPVSLQQIAAFAAWKTNGGVPLFVIHDAGTWNHQSSSLGGPGRTHAVRLAESGPRAVPVTPSVGFHPALRLLAAARCPEQSRAIHGVIESPRSLELHDSPRLERDECPLTETDRLLRRALADRGVPLASAARLLSAF